MAAITTEGANVMEGTKVSEASGSGQSKVGSARKKNRSRSASASSVDSVSSGSYTGIEEIRYERLISSLKYCQGPVRKKRMNLPEK